MGHLHSCQTCESVSFAISKSDPLSSFVYRLSSPYTRDTVIEDLLNVITCPVIVISNQVIVIGLQAIVTEFPFTVIGLRFNVSLQYLASDFWWFPVSVWMTVSIRQNLYGTTQFWVTCGTQLKADRKWPFAAGRLGSAGVRDWKVNLFLFVAFELRWNEAYCRQSDSLIQWGLERHTFNWDMFPERSVAQKPASLVSLSGGILHQHHAALIRIISKNSCWYKPKESFRKCQEKVLQCEIFFGVMSCKMLPICRRCAAFNFVCSSSTNISPLRGFQFCLFVFYRYVAATRLSILSVRLLLICRRHGLWILSVRLLPICPLYAAVRHLEVHQRDHSTPIS